MKVGLGLLGRRGCEVEDGNNGLGMMGFVIGFGLWGFGFWIRVCGHGYGMGILRVVEYVCYEYD